MSSFLSAIFVPICLFGARYQALSINFNGFFNQIVKLTENFQIQLNSDEKTLRKLNSLKEVLEAEIKKALEQDDLEEYFSNPIKAFEMIKHLTLDLQKILDAQPINSFPPLLSALSTELAELRSESKFPTIKDLLGVMDAILRIADVYAVNEEEILNGQFANWGDIQLQGDDLDVFQHYYNFSKKLDRFSEEEYYNPDRPIQTLSSEFFKATQFAEELFTSIRDEWLENSTSATL